jgi:hypothetical protein
MRNLYLCKVRGAEEQVSLILFVKSVYFCVGIHVYVSVVQEFLTERHRNTLHRNELPRIRLPKNA